MAAALCVASLLGELEYWPVAVCRRLRASRDPGVKFHWLAWSELVVLVSFTRVLVVIVLGPRDLLAGSELHDPEQKARRLPSPAIAWFV